jgi:hypothetical protein
MKIWHVPQSAVPASIVEVLILHGHDEQFVCDALAAQALFQCLV